MRILSLLTILLFTGACNSAAPDKQTSSTSYFDLKTYISKESQRLSAANPEITKTVIVNGSQEQKRLHIADWPKELSSFTDADLNKSAWQGLFNVKKTPQSVYYTSDNDKVPVKSLKVDYKDGLVTGVQVLIRNENSLYTSTDTLSYVPDSLYQIKKTQHITLMKEKRYSITGRFH